MKMTVIFKSKTRSFKSISNPFSSTYRHHCGMGAASGCISGIGAIESSSVGDAFSGDASGCGGCGGCGG